MIEITIAGLFSTQVCSDEPAEAVIAWMDEREVSSARWELASASVMSSYGPGDPNPRPCGDRPGHQHYLLVVRGWFEDHPERCADCGQWLADDASGLCLECQPGYQAEAPGSITSDQERAITAACTDLGLLVFDGLDDFSQKQAGDYLLVLEHARRNREERTRCQS